MPLLWLLAPLLPIPLKRRTVWNNFGIRPILDTTKGQALLANDFRTIDESAVDMFQQMIDFGIVEDKTEKS